MFCQNRGDVEKNVRVVEGEEVQVDLNSSLPGQGMGGTVGESERGRLVKVKRDFVRCVCVCVFYSILTDFNGDPKVLREVT